MAKPPEVAFVPLGQQRAGPCLRPRWRAQDSRWPIRWTNIDRNRLEQREKQFFSLRTNRFDNAGPG